MSDLQSVKSEVCAMSKIFTLDDLSEYISVYNGDRESLPVFLANCNFAMSLATTYQKNILTKFILSQLAGIAQIATSYKTFSTWDELQTFLINTFGGRQHTHIKSSTPVRKSYHINNSNASNFKFCNYCKKIGHMIQECHKLQSKNNKRTQNNSQAQVSLGNNNNNTLQRHSCSSAHNNTIITAKNDIDYSENRCNSPQGKALSSINTSRKNKPKCSSQNYLSLNKSLNFYTSQSKIDMSFRNLLTPRAKVSSLIYYTSRTKDSSSISQNNLSFTINNKSLIFHTISLSLIDNEFS